MKKQIKKLTLNRETLRAMEQRHLEAVAGGSGAPSGVTVCYPTFYNSFCRFCVDEPIGP
jgi:uncharacterized membrane protein